jgi:adenine-specific DNA-methyltransferase
MTLATLLAETRPMLGESGKTASSRHGEVFTRRWIVELILDFSGYTPDRDLAAFVAVEPACGTGAFLIPMAERLAASCARHGRDITDAGTAIAAYDLLAPNVLASRQAVASCLRGAGLPGHAAHRLAGQWVSQADFLLSGPRDAKADFVLGNPPYIRLEDVPADKSDAYRIACRTMRGRSVVFVGFVERGLGLLRDGGVLGYIVADRWMRNQYGAALRAMITDGFSVDSLIQLHDVDAFENRVSAYPAITVIRRGPQGQAVIADAGAAFGPAQAASLSRWAKSSVAGQRLSSDTIQAARLTGWFAGSSSWPAGTPEELAVVADLEARFPPLEDPRTGTHVGIGVATGADSVYLTRDPDCVEHDRLLPLTMARDTALGTASWSGTYLISPWRDGRLVSLADYPLLRDYFAAHEAPIRARHTARRNPASWYRTIDRVEPGLLARPKLLFPDLKASIHPVLEEGSCYPHHNLYFVVSDEWDLDVPGGLMLSDVANLFVGAYCVKMRGGCYRFQAQYLRRIRVPRPSSVSAAAARALAAAFRARDVKAAPEVALELYGITALPSSCRTSSGTR